MKYSHLESKVLEFKEKQDDYARLLQVVVAFANMQGGTIILGIRDKDREIIGLSDTDIERYHAELPQAVADAVAPQIALDLFEQNLGGKTCLVIRVFPGPHKPYFIKRLGCPDGIFVRFGSHNRKADDYTVQELTREKTGTRFEDTPVPQLTFADLSRDLMSNVLQKMDEREFIGSGFGTVDVAGRTIPNIAGTLLFFPEHKRMVAESTISVVQYAGKDKQNLMKSETLEGGIHRILELSFGYLSALLGRRYQIEGTTKVPQELELPKEALREALVNAIAHRAYDYEAPIRISVFSNRVEFLNPGSFYAPIHSENLQEGLSRYRNPLIADALRKTGHMEKQGIGISRIIDSCQGAGLLTPSFVELEHFVKVTLYMEQCGGTHGERAAVIVERPSTPREIFSKVETLSSAELAQHIGKSQAMAKKILQKLKKQGVIEPVGRGPATRYRWVG
jgi:ATP-dependent DNA helicase RecG